MCKFEEIHTCEDFDGLKHALDDIDNEKWNEYGLLFRNDICCYLKIPR